MYPLSSQALRITAESPKVFMFQYSTGNTKTHGQEEMRHVSKCEQREQEMQEILSKATVDWRMKRDARSACTLPWHLSLHNDGQKKNSPRTESHTSHLVTLERPSAPLDCPPCSTGWKPSEPTQTPPRPSTKSPKSTRASWDAGVDELKSALSSDPECGPNGALFLHVEVRKNMWKPYPHHQMIVCLFHVWRLLWHELSIPSKPTDYGACHTFCLTQHRAVGICIAFGIGIECEPEWCCSLTLLLFKRVRSPPAFCVESSAAFCTRRRQLWCGTRLSSSVHMCIAALFELLHGDPPLGPYRIWLNVCWDLVNLPRFLRVTFWWTCLQYLTSGEPVQSPDIILLPSTF